MRERLQVRDFHYISIPGRITHLGALTGDCVERSGIRSSEREKMDLP